MPLDHAKADKRLLMDEMFAKMAEMSIVSFRRFFLDERAYISNDAISEEESEESS